MNDPKYGMAESVKKKSVNQKSDETVFLTFGDIRKFIKEFRRYNSADSKIGIHKAYQFDGCCVIINIREYDACEGIESHGRE